MSVINQMLRELDARGGASAEVPVAPTRPPAQERRLAWLGLGAAGLVAAGGAAIYWMLPATPGRDEPRHVPAIARQETKEPEMPRVASTSVQAARQPAAAIPAVNAPPHTQGGEPVRKEGREAQEAKVPALPASPPPAPVQSFLSLDMDTSQLAPASVRKVMLLTPEAEAQQYYDEAQALRRAGKLDAAMGKYRQALERNPAMTGARLQLVRLLQDKGQVDAALALLKAGYELRADDGLAIAAGRLLADRGQRESALDWLQRGQSSWRPADHALMGALLSQAHRYEEASRAYRQALAADPGQGGWLLGLGLALEAQGRLEEARMVYRNALERGQFKPEVIRFLQEHSGVSGQ